MSELTNDLVNLLYKDPGIKCELSLW